MRCLHQQTCCLLSSCTAAAVILHRRFFESLYSALCAVLHEAFDKLGKRAVLEQELGRLFRYVR